MTRLPLTLVPGVGRGVGATIELAREGGPVICAARSVESCTEVANAIQADGGLANPAHINVADADTFETGLVDALDDARAIPCQSNLCPFRWYSALSTVSGEIVWKAIGELGTLPHA